MAIILPILAAVMLSASVSLVSGTPGGCLVKKYEQLTNTTDTRILSFIKLDKHLDFIVEFEDRDVTYWRDWVELTNSRVTHAKVRDGMSNPATDDLPLVFGEGWNNLRLQAVGTSFSLTLVSRDGEEATLLNLRLDFPVTSIHVEGTFSFCSEGSPEWEVAEGEEVSVPLQPDDNQQLQVNGRGLVPPYLVVLSEDSDTETRTDKDISANTTLTIVTRRRRSMILVKVFQDDEETLADMEQHAASVLMGCRSGTLHLRLDLSASTTKEDSHSADSGDFVALWPLGCVLLAGGMMFGVLVGVVATLLCTRKKRRGATKSGSASPPNACEGKLLPV